MSDMFVVMSTPCFFFCLFFFAFYGGGPLLVGIQPTFGGNTPLIMGLGVPSLSF